MNPFEELVKIVARLRGPDGCPWDKEQTHKSLTPYAVEEALELEEAIHNEDWENVKEELGDLLFQSVLHSQIASENDQFNIDDVIKTLNTKMVQRHPHVFADVKVQNSAEVLKNWEEIKSQEKPKKVTSLFDIPATFPALLRSQKIGKRTQRLDFDWSSSDEVLVKLREEFAELEEAYASKDIHKMNEELGDLLFTAAQMARHLDLDAEKSLRQANEKFVGRFTKMVKSHKNFENLSRDQKEAAWNKVKSEE
ncbi:MAG: nucleoside triphosphate pyrophosphohydrolase [Bdellovibrionales bacterium]|nr:nucleoside triphosphate pyrophosphohydrolase [Bdellovibrionales bacterium]